MGQYVSPYVGMGNNPVSGIDPDGGWTWLTAAWKRMGSLIRGERPGPLQKRNGEWGYYYSKAGKSTGNYAEVIGGRNFGPNRFANEVLKDIINSAWKPTNDHLVQYNTITKQLRWTGSGAITPVYIEFEIALTAYTGGQYLLAKQAGKTITAEGAVWAQTSFSKTFSIEGKFAGKTVDEVVGMLKAGTLTASDVPVDVIVRNGRTFILNTRSSAALTQAGIDRSAWTVINRTGQLDFETRLTKQLVKNGIPNGTNTIKSGSTILTN
jgi:hypothetical protein